MGSQNREKVRHARAMGKHMQFGRDIKNRLVAIIDKLSMADVPLISRIICGKPLGDGTKGLEAFVLGIKYKITAVDGDVEVLVEDPLNREEDSSRLLIFMLNAFERAFKGFLVCHKGRLMSLTQLPGGKAAQLYERRITNFLAVEMNEAKIEEVERAAGKVGGSIVEHSDATWSFEISPLSGIRIRVAYWQGEEEMPSGAALLIGEEIRDANVPLEELVVLMEMAINRFVLFYRKETGKKPKLFKSLYL